MKYLFLILLLACSSLQRDPASEIKAGPFQIEMVHHPKLGIDFRTGVFKESSKVQFQGCVLYLQGLADSILNHEPLFYSLSQHGFRVITFDYMGQGGSEGEMNDTRITAHTKRPELISEQAKWLWSLQAASCKNSPKRVIGWSTGGLAAYKLANEKWAQQVVLLAPGIHPKVMVGESANDWSRMYLFKDTITLRTLTRQQYVPGRDPHVDPIFPDSPAKVPGFAINLLKSSKLAQQWKIDPKIRGLVLLSGKEDSYVELNKTILTMKKNSPHFELKHYPGALHELDNEIPSVAEDVRKEILQFFR